MEILRIPCLKGVGGSLFSRGLYTIAEMANRRGHKATVHPYVLWKEVRDRLRADASPIVIVGHSMGVDKAEKISRNLAPRPIAAIISIDSAYPEKKPENVERVLSIVSGIDRRFHVTGRNVTRHRAKGTWHVTVDDEPAVQKMIIDLIDEIANGTKSENPMQRFYMGEGRRLSEADMAALSSEYQIPEYLVRTVVQVEAAGKGSHSSGALVFRYELHKGWKYSSGKVRDRLAAEGYANPSYSAARRFKLANDYPTLERIAEIAGEELACMASSWGMGQVMGFNHELLGFDSALAMVRDFAVSERNQIAGMLRFIERTGLKKQLLNEDWHGFAEGYNGKNYRTNNYHGKLDSAARDWKRRIGAGIAATRPPAPIDESGEIIPAGGEELSDVDRSRIDYLARRIVFYQRNFELINPNAPAIEASRPVNDQQKGDGLMMFMDGKKTHFVALIVVLIGVMEGLLGADIPGVNVGDDWLNYVLTGLGLSSVRDGIRKIRDIV